MNLGYVLNIIENEQEYREALKNAWNLAGKLLIVSAQVSVIEPGRGHMDYNDGFITTCNTFQKYLEQSELKQFIDDNLDADTVPAGLGIYFVFRNETVAEAFSVSRFRSRATYSLNQIKIKNFAGCLSTLQPLMDFTAERGRLPVDGELKMKAKSKKNFALLHELLK